MDGGKCILQLRGVRPFFSDKYDITRHKQYPMLLDDNPEMEFDIEKYVGELKRKHLKISRENSFTEFEIDMTAAAQEVKSEETGLSAEQAGEKEIYVGF